jgi:excisionase family DNA binding protein
VDNPDGSDPSVGSAAVRRDDVGFGITGRKEPMDLQLRTVDEAAAKLAVGKTTVYLLMSSGRLPSVKIGRSRRIRVADFRHFIENLEEGHQAWVVRA